MLTSFDSYHPSSYKELHGNVQMLRKADKCSEKKMFDKISSVRRFLVSKINHRARKIHSKKHKGLPKGWENLSKGPTGQPSHFLNFFFFIIGYFWGYQERLLSIASRKKRARGHFVPNPGKGGARLPGEVILFSCSFEYGINPVPGSFFHGPASLHPF